MINTRAPQMAVCLCVTLAAHGLGACFVQGKCHSDEDCSGRETCNLLSGSCQVECSTDADCFVGGQPMGKECFDNRCQWRLDERVKAPEFCLEVIYFSLLT